MKPALDFRKTSVVASVSYDRRKRVAEDRFWPTKELLVRVKNFVARAEEQGVRGVGRTAGSGFWLQSATSEAATIYPRIMGGGWVSCTKRRARASARRTRLSRRSSQPKGWRQTSPHPLRSLQPSCEKEVQRGCLHPKCRGIQIQPVTPSCGPQVRGQEQRTCGITPLPIPKWRRAMDSQREMRERKNHIRGAQHSPGVQVRV